MVLNSEPFPKPVWILKKQTDLRMTSDTPKKENHRLALEGVNRPPNDMDFQTNETHQQVIR